jgi:hypothetical protein
MNRILILLMRAAVVLAGTAIAQSITVIGTEDPAQDSPATGAGLFMDAGGSNTVLVGHPGIVEDHGSVVVPWTANANGVALER